MPVSARKPSKLFSLKPFLLAIVLAVPPTSGAYDFPLSPNAIRDAYFAGTRAGSTGDGQFLPQYTHTIPDLKLSPCVSKARLETPFFQVAAYASRQLHYSAQDAITDFESKGLTLRIHLEICYAEDAPLPDAIRLEVTQNKKELAPLSESRSSYFPPGDKFARVTNMGEKIDLEFDPSKIDSSTLTLHIETPDGQEATINFDLQALR